MESQLNVSLLERNVMDIVNCKFTAENDFPNNLVGSQLMNNSFHEINNGSRYASYVSEAVQQEVDGIGHTQEVNGSEHVKDSSSLPEDIYVDIMMSKIAPRLGELLPPGTLSFEVMNSTSSNNLIHSPPTDIYKDDFTGSINIVTRADVTQKDVAAPLSAESPNDLLSDMKRRPHKGHSDLAQTTLAAKKKCLYEETPFDDKVREKKRKDAIRAKRNRDNKKDLLSLLEVERTARIKLEEEVVELKKQADEMRRVIEALQTQVGL